MTLLSNRLFTAASVLLLVGCNGNKNVAGGTIVGEAPDTVVATYGNGVKVTLKQVDDLIADELGEMDKKKFQLRRGTIDRIVIEALVKAEAAKKNQKEEEWVKAEIESKIPDPSDAELQELFNKYQSQMPPGSTLETMRPQLIAAAKQGKGRDVAQQAFDALKKANNVVVTFKEPPKPKKQVEAVGPSKGPDGAKVTIVEFSDFQCPFCSRASTTVDQVMEQYAGKVKLVFRHFPLDFHDKAPKAAEAGLCADDQKKFWEMHDMMFKNQDKLGVEDLKAHAAAIGLDAAKFAECLDTGKKKSVVDGDIAAGKKVGVTGTPAFFINGVMLSGAQPLEVFKETIDDELKQ